MLRREILNTVSYSVKRHEGVELFRSCSRGVSRSCSGVEPFAPLRRFRQPRALTRLEAMDEADFGRAAQGAHMINLGSVDVLVTSEAPVVSTVPRA